MKLFVNGIELKSGFTEIGVDDCICVKKSQSVGKSEDSLGGSFALHLSKQPPPHTLAYPDFRKLFGLK